MIHVDISLLGCIADTYLMYLFFSHYFNERKILAESKIRYVFYVMFAYLWFTVSWLGNGDYSLFISASFIFAYVMLILKGQYAYKLFCYVLFLVILFGCEFLFMLIFQPDAESYKNSLDTEFLMIATKFLTYLIIILVSRFTGRVKRKLTETLEQQIVLTKQEADLMLYNKVAQMNEMQRELLHNTKHYLLLIRKYAVENDVESILQMTEQLSEEMRENERMIFTTNSVLNTILNEKYVEAANYGIKADFYVEPGVVMERISPVDLMSMLGNLLDNAIYAAKSCTKKKFIKVYVYMQDVNGFCVVKVVNGFSGKLLYEDGNLQSTKSEDGIHGVGIRSINRLAEKYEGTLVCTPKENIFEAVLILSTSS